MATTDLPSKEISNITGYNDTAVIRINKGELRKKEGLNYPLRKELTKDYLDDRANKIIEDLLYSSLTQKEIANKYGVGRTTITAINNGQNHKKENIQYPIRKEKIANKGKSVSMLDIESLEVIKTFSSAKEAAIYLGKNRGDYITQCIRENKNGWGYKWKYTEE